MSNSAPTRLSEDAVRERLSLCAENSQVIDELYSFGKTLESEVLDRIRSLESKGTSFAAYGAAIVTFLVSSASLWSKVGNRYSPWIAVCAGISGLMCTYYALRVLLLRQYEWTSEDEWLKAECLADIATLKRYRILTTWGVIHSHGTIHKEKTKDLQQAQIWLAGAVIFLVYLLLQVAALRSLVNELWIARWKGVIQSHLGITGWQWCGGCWCALVLVLTLALIAGRARRGTRLI